MFGKSEDNEIVEVKTGPLNTFYVDGITAKRKKTNEINQGHDIIVVIHTNATEEEFKRLLDDFIAENEDYYMRSAPAPGRRRRQPAP